MNEITVTVFKDLFKSKDVPFHVPLEKIIKRIKSALNKILSIKTAKRKGRS